MKGVEEEKVGEMRERGFCVIDEFMGRERARRMRDEISMLKEMGKLTPNKVQFSLNGRIEHFTKPNIYEADMHDPSIREHVTELTELFFSDEMVQLLQETFPELHLKLGTRARTLKLQMNAGQGGCFPLHYDNPGRPNMRKVTCLLYLNEGWKEGDGGELELVPFLGKPVVIEPIMDRMVLFRSDLLLHRVLPNKEARYCLTIWIDAEEGHVNRDEDVMLKISRKEESIESVVEQLRRSPSQRALSRAIYDQEYKQSILDCMQTSEEVKPMIAAHELHVAATHANATLSSLVRLLASLREDV
ncbi:hypothetical protein GUITHDRAFT_158359 [Guillardia theta CCMP2712]|uniref:Fe2OG dioxygenase domain-containing protein n=1 Tax=Guillardia theta (strain CCMP2712) TaxID=905079 RepID=L1IUX9_GUITC|nr:hypothetical protein GUITHDRAFT_158359 [Guillardia theta CCMP2712]EKX39892.1 hypothetical protein GUITHDRAFT_158359 [Guillardia theta CCMP2712]|eukprot:XP_005826872.1 hypothetical protein GUITHDRAFT_158359 [Guillardia theta CCMP2712]